VVSRRAQLGDFPLGGVGQLVGLAPGRGPDRVGLALGRAPQVVGLALGVRAQLGRLVLGGGPQFRGVHLGRGLDLVRFRPSRLDELGGLFFGQPEQLLDTGTEAGVGRAFLLLDLALRVRQLLPHGLALLAMLAHFGFDLPDVLVDLVAVVAPHDRRELARRGLFEEVGQLGVNVRLHMA
jgi:hypothetical protein